jgi:hypothetical protein
VATAPVLLQMLVKERLDLVEASLRTPLGDHAPA